MVRRKDLRKEKIIRSIELPDGVSASISSTVLTIKGKNGEAQRSLKQKNVSITATDKKIVLETRIGTKSDKKEIGSLTAHVKNMIRGVAQNHVYTLKICSGHFPMNVGLSGSRFTIKNFLGEKVPRVLELKKGATVKVEGEIIYVSSASKETAGQVSADIEQLTRRPGFDTRIFQDGIYITNKDGKQLK